MVNELICINTYSRSSTHESFLPSSLLTRGPEYCHHRSDCVPGGEVQHLQEHSQPDEEGHGRSPRADGSGVFQDLFGGGWSVCFAGEFTARGGTPLSLGLPEVLKSLEPLQHEKNQPSPITGQPRSGQIPARDTDVHSSM